ncbi:hypothetical protein ACTVZO_42650 [Streptomyces sp. IBSNAI002]|uniref:hypothetical protein n=1 Tax=Streptomyces sp. IBSNAI002 TaxID=3457500 RepID=UPI003FD1B5DA
MTTWKQKGAAWLRPGGLFCAVLIPAAVMHTAAQGNSPQACAGRIAEVLEGPVFYDPSAFRQGGGYTVLLPASAALLWRVPGTVLHPSRRLLLVPAPDRCEPVDGRPWWVVPLERPGMLCAPQPVACFAALGRRRLGPVGSEIQ